MEIPKGFHGNTNGFHFLPKWPLRCKPGPEAELFWGDVSNSRWAGLESPLKLNEQSLVLASADVSTELGLKGPRNSGSTYLINECVQEHARFCHNMRNFKAARMKCKTRLKKEVVCSMWLSWCQLCCRLAPSRQAGEHPVLGTSRAGSTPGFQRISRARCSFLCLLCPRYLWTVSQLVGNMSNV